MKSKIDYHKINRFIDLVSEDEELFSHLCEEVEREKRYLRANKAMDGRPRFFAILVSILFFIVLVAAILSA